MAKKKAGGSGRGARGAATRMPDNGGDFSGPEASSDPEVAKLAEKAREENERKRKAAERRRNVSDDQYKRHKKTIKSKKAELDKAQSVVKTINGQLRELYAAAKDDGLDTNALKKVIALEAMDADDVATEFSNVARIIRATNSPLMQLNLFAEEVEEADKQPRAVGFAMGKRGESHDHIADRYKPGSEEYVEADKGWRDGQAELANEMFRKGKGPDPKAGGAALN